MADAHGTAEANAKLSVAVGASRNMLC